MALSCPDCGQDIFKAEAKGKRVMLDAVPTPKGEHRYRLLGTKMGMAEAISANYEVYAYTDHAFTCPVKNR